MTDKELDDLFQHKLSGHQMPVPPGMWQRVNPQKEKRRRAIILWWSGLGVAALFVFFGAATWLYHSSSPEQKQVSATAAAPVRVQPATGSATNTTTGSQPSISNGKADLPGDGSSSAETSSQSLVRSHYQTQTSNSYIDQNKHKTNTADAGEAQSAVNYATNNTKKSKPAYSSVKSETNNGEAHITQSNDASSPVTASNSNQATLSPGLSPQAGSSLLSHAPDSAATAVNNTAAQSAKAAAVQVKKIHGEKATSLELMVAGYGSSRHVYDADHFSTAGLVPFGPVSQKEKVLMNSFSINARIDKPLTRNFSLKTGLQFLQTHQQVSYNYETVDQAMFINSVSRDTTVLARLQSKQSLIKGTYNSLNVPVLLSYHTNGTKLSVGATAGVMLNVLSWYKGSVPDAGSSQSINAKSVFRRHTGTSLYAGLTASKQVGSFQLFAEPHIQYTLSSITKSSASFRQKITGYGFGIGIRKTIGKQKPVTSVVRKQ